MCQTRKRNDVKALASDVCDECFDASMARAASESVLVDPNDPAHGQFAGWADHPIRLYDSPTDFFLDQRTPVPDAFRDAFR